MSTRDLRELAEAATPGPWQEVTSGDDDWMVLALCEQPVGIDVTGSGLPESDAEYIAAVSPDRVLALLDALADLKAAARGLLDAMTRFGPDDSGQLWDAAQALRALVGDETPGTGDGA